MIIFKKQEDLSKHLNLQSVKGIKYGFVPTMGALHDGHLSLVHMARSGNDRVISSIFINPTQFNNPEDFKLYPVTIEEDIEKLEKAGCDILFLPSVNEIYPSSWKQQHYDLGAVEHILEGYFRPGHFQGVCQVVDRFLEIIEPGRMYLGQKDFQQCIIIKKLIEITGREVELVIVPTVREKDGLAMSSRNLRLTPAQRQQAITLYKVLVEMGSKLNDQSIPQLKMEARDQLVKNGFEVDYVELANREDLSPAFDTGKPLVALIAATIGKVRLIDNLSFN